MVRYYELAVTRMYSAELVEAWAKGEANLGLKDSFFVMKNGVVEQYINSDEGEKFHEDLKKKLTTEYFGEICDKFYKAIDEDDKVKMFECLCVFGEIDEYPDIANPDILRRLMRVRQSTQHLIYE